MTGRKGAGAAGLGAPVVVVTRAATARRGAPAGGHGLGAGGELHGRGHRRGRRQLQRRDAGAAGRPGAAEQGCAGGADGSGCARRPARRCDRGRRHDFPRRGGPPRRWTRWRGRSARSLQRPTCHPVRRARQAGCRARSAPQASAGPAARRRCSPPSGIRGGASGAGRWPIRVRDGARPVPVGHQHQVVKRIGPPQRLVAGLRTARGRGGCRPGARVASHHRSPRPDRPRPGRGPRHAVGPVQQRRRCGACPTGVAPSPSRLSRGTPAAADACRAAAGRRNAAPAASGPDRRGGHSRCPDFFALVAR